MKKLMSISVAAIIALTMSMPTVSFAEEETVVDTVYEIEGTEDILSADEMIEETDNGDSINNNLDTADTEETESISVSDEITENDASSDNADESIDTASNENNTMEYETIADSDVLPEQAEDLYANTEIIDGNVKYSIDKEDNNAYVTGYIDSPTDVTIKSTVDGYSVVQINNNAFSDCISLKSLYVPASVKTIGTYAFKNCKALNSLKLNEGLQKLGRGAFEDCISLVSVNIPSTLTEAGSYDWGATDGVFMGCTSLKTVDLKGYVVGTAMFRDCTSLESINIPSTVTYVGKSAFQDCEFLKKAVINSSGTIDENAFNGCIRMVSAELGGSKVTEIGAGGFQNCTALSVLTLPESVKTIETYAFKNCKVLNNVKLNEGLQRLGRGAFEDCIALISVNIPSTLTEAGSYDWGATEGVFMGCTSLKTVDLKGYVVGTAMFRDCTSLESINIPSTVTYVGKSAFQDCEFLKEVVINSSGTIDENAFNGCTRMVSAELSGSKVTEIGAGGFENCTALSVLTLPESVKTIATYAFKNCKVLNYVKLNEGLQKLGRGAFEDCISLVSVNIPSTLTEAGSYDWGATEGVFMGCTSLKTVDLKGYVVGIAMFRDCTSLESINIPSTVTYVGENAFCDCTSLKTAYFSGNAPTDFGTNAFAGCADGFKIYYLDGKHNWTTPEWNGYPCYPVNSIPQTPPADTVKVEPPSFVVKGIFGGRNVTFNCKTSGATIYYTTENRSALKLTDPCVKPGETVTFNAYYGTVYARAYYNGKWSNPARLILRIPKVNDPTITKLSNGKVKIRTTTPSCIVYYTTDGSVPSASNYAGKFWTSHDVKIPAGKTVKAIAVRSCFSDSKVTTKRI